MGVDVDVYVNVDVDADTDANVQTGTQDDLSACNLSCVRASLQCRVFFFLCSDLPL